MIWTKRRRWPPNSAPKTPFEIAPTRWKLPRPRPKCCVPWHNCAPSSGCARNAEELRNFGVFMQLSVVILAAGQGKRMTAALPKVLQPLAGEPLLQHVIRTARGLGPDNIYVVYGHGGAQVQAALGHEELDWIPQAEQLGTGHAVMQAMSVIPDDHTVLVLYGDVPLIRSDTLKRLVGAAD